MESFYLNLMKHLASILFFVLSLALPGGIIPQADAVSFSDNTPEILQAKSQTSSAQNLFWLIATYQQAETGSNTADSLFDSSVEHESQEEYTETAVKDTSVQQQAVLQLAISRTLEHSLTIKRLIYPSHYFL